MPAEVPPDPDDDDVGAAGRAAACARHGRGLGAAPSARHHHGGRPDPLPGAHAVHDAGDLPLVRSPRAALERRRGGGRKPRRERTAMNLPEPSIRRPVVTPLPQVDFPTISVQAQLPGASPEVMAATVATPLERALGRIAGVTEITSSSSLGNSRITLQFDLDRDIDGAARDVQAAINAARSQLPTSLPRNPTYRKVNPADAPVMILSLTSDTLDRGEMYDAASTILAQKISQAEGVGQVTVGGASLPAVRVEMNPSALNKYGIAFDDVRAALAAE